MANKYKINNIIDEVGKALRIIRITMVTMGLNSIESTDSKPSVEYGHRIPSVPNDVSANRQFDVLVYVAFHACISHVCASGSPI